jgi:hypothetical protein
MFAQAHGNPGISPAGRFPVVLHPNASHSLTPPYDAAPARVAGPSRFCSSPFRLVSPKLWQRQAVVAIREDAAPGTRGDRELGHRGLAPAQTLAFE